MVSPAEEVALAEAVAAAATANLPIVIQDYPAGSGVQLTVDEIAGAAANEPLVVAAKIESLPSSSKIAALRRLASNMDAVGGLGGLYLIDELRAGATGSMTGAAFPAELVEILNTYPSDPDAAERVWLPLLPVLRFEAFAPYNLAARKEAWRLRGVIRSSFCRRPGVFLDDVARADIARAVEAVTAGGRSTSEEATLTGSRQPN
jgi:4-hydroxy-tetrahydrodipicolinate synthase